MISPGDIRLLLRELGRQGWRVQKTANMHYKALAPDGKNTVLFSDSRDPHSWSNTIVRLKKAGFRA